MFQQMQAMAQKQVSHTQSPFSSFHIYNFFCEPLEQAASFKKENRLALSFSLYLSHSL